MKRRHSHAAWKRSGSRKSAQQMRAREAQPRGQARAELRAVRLTVGSS